MRNVLSKIGSRHRRWHLAIVLMAAIMLVLTACAPVNRSIKSNAPPVLSPRSGLSKNTAVTVLPGQTVYSIARANGVSLRSLIEENGLTPPYVLAIGQTLRLPQVTTYVVAAGDTVSIIAQRLNIDMRLLVNMNNIRAPYLIRVGQRLRLPRTRGGGLPAVQFTSATSKQPTEKPVQVPTVMALPLSRPESIAPHRATARTPSTAAKAVTKAAVKAVQNRSAPAKRHRNLTPAPRSRSKFLVPVNGRVIGRFGPRKGGLHNDGINIAAPVGAPIKAAENGVVAYAGAGFGGFGNLLLIKHADGWISAYGHARKLLVKRGAKVRRGQVIATVGKSGAVTRPQLHFELRRGSRALNPEKYISS